MKGLMIFFTLALVATASCTSIGHKKIERDFISDALALEACLMKVLPEVESAVDKLTGTVSNVAKLVEDNKTKVEACLAIGGSNPTTIDQLHEAECMISLIGQMVKELAGIIVDIEGSVAEVGAAGKDLAACFTPQ